MPSPQSLVTFVSALLVLLLATRTQLELSPLLSAIASVVLALALAWIVDRRVPVDDDADITEEIREEPRADY